MRKTKEFAQLGLAFVIGSLIAVPLAAPAAPAKQKDIVQTAVDAGSFTKLAKALEAAGLVDTLRGKGPFTVFAPTDAAFEQVEKAHPGTLASLLKPENKQKLASISTYHVVPGRVLAKDVVKLKNGTKVKTVNGQSLIVTNHPAVKVDNAKVVKTDILCSNWVIHVIDSVILSK